MIHYNQSRHHLRHSGNLFLLNQCFFNLPDEVLDFAQTFDEVALRMANFALVVGNLLYVLWCINTYNVFSVIWLLTSNLLTCLLQLL